MSAIVSVLDLSQAVVALFDGGSLPLYKSVVDPPPPADDQNVTLPYAVFHPHPGDTNTEGEESGNLARRPGLLLWGFHMTAVGGDQNYCSFAVEEVRRRIDGCTLTVAGARVGLMQPPFGAVNSPMVVNPNVRPVRLSVSLEYRVLTVPA